MLREGEAYCTYAYTVEAWCGRAIHTEVASRMLQFVKEAEYETAYTGVGVENRASWKTHLRLGWELSGLALSLRRRKADKMQMWTMVWGARVRRARTATSETRASAA